MKNRWLIGIFSGLLLITGCSALWGPDEEQKTRSEDQPEKAPPPSQDDEADSGENLEISPESVLKQGADPTVSAKQEEGQQSGEQEDSQRDKSRQSPPTPLDQSSAPEDVELTRNIRSAITSDQSLSFDARNITIITMEGTVTLRGSVRSEEERSRVLSIVKNVMKKGRIYDRLKVSGS